ncbi:hypothetical protein PsorP6_007173 [Peronosclerospora sorghi]|uniref:Uncharacterized protein n=1 Tax=Peronosclerospora sorghi TaxID=230839 RepID=A0ACC0W6L5_9STRA|nr:hypothetical protein PsorP6_007173 [Peronosclerospora sorghi]
MNIHRRHCLALRLVHRHRERKSDSDLTSQERKEQSVNRQRHGDLRDVEPPSDVRFSHNFRDDDTTRKATEDHARSIAEAGT